MVGLRRRFVVAGVGTLASGLVLRKPADAQGLPGLAGMERVAGRAVPTLSMTLVDGTFRTLADFAGKGVVLNFWATWCVPCVAEMAALDALAGAVAGSGVLVLPLSSDRGGVAVVQRFYAERGVKHLPVLLDPLGAAARAVGSRGIPTTLLIDGGGRERGRMEGAADWGGAESVGLVRRMVGGGEGGRT